MSHYLCEVKDVTATGKEVCLKTDHGSIYVMLFQHAGNVRAFLNVCPHQGRPLNWAPDRFLFSPERLLVCAQHGATFELDSGECVAGPCRGARLRQLATRLEGDAIWLDEDLTPGN